MSEIVSWYSAKATEWVEVPLAQIGSIGKGLNVGKDYEAGVGLGEFEGPLRHPGGDIGWTLLDEGLENFSD